MSDSQSHSISQEEIIYEEQEVLWAKIRGYPWWPAFVDKVHDNNGKDQMQYTVFFFGDNTHSRLGGSKLRRFLDYYTEFFPKAKTNRKLYLSIMKAQQKLKQNGGNVEIFENLRNSLKKSKKHVGRPQNRTQSKIDSQDHQQNVSQQPELVRNKTFSAHQAKQPKQKNASQQLSEQKPTMRRRGRRSRKQIEQQQKEQLEKKQKCENQESQQQQSMQQEKVEKSQQQNDIQQPMLLNYRTRSGRNKVTQNTEAMIDEKNQKPEEQNNEQQEDVSQQNIAQQNAKKTTYPLRFANKTKPIMRGGPKKRGRPKKVPQENNVPSSSQESQQQEKSQSANENNNKNAPNLARSQSLTENRKIRIERNQASRIPLSNRLSQKQKPLAAEENNQKSQKPETSQQARQLILQRVKFCLDKRNQLIEYLDELIITTDIVQEILDLSVSTIILQGGQHSTQSIRVLHKLRSALEHKYFPKDIKIKKKYQKFSKRANSSKTNAPENQESLQDLDLRRKTLIKLQKILKNVDQNEDQKSRAIMIESHFRKYDESIGNGYKTMAYKVLRSLKDKTVQIEQVLPKLEAGEFDEDQK